MPRLPLNWMIVSWRSEEGNHAGTANGFRGSASDHAVILRVATVTLPNDRIKEFRGNQSVRGDHHCAFYKQHEDYLPAGN